MPASVYSRTLRKAADLLGGEAKLCRLLRVPAAELRKWLEDRAVPPVGSFLRAVDVVLSQTSGPSSSDPADTPAPRDCSGPEDASSTSLC